MGASDRHRAAATVILLGTEELGGGVTHRIDWPCRSRSLWRSADSVGIAARAEGVAAGGAGAISRDFVGVAVLADDAGRERRGGVAGEVPLGEAVARCFSLLRRHRRGERTGGSRARIVREVAELAGWLRGLGLPPGVVEREVLAPVRAYLVARYGDEMGRRLTAEIVAVFEASAMGRSPPRGEEDPPN